MRECLDSPPADPPRPAPDADAAPLASRSRWLGWSRSRCCPRSAAERRLYEGFLEQLGDEYVVYHSVDWVMAAAGSGPDPEQGEADFVIAHPEDGVLALEAKGGRSATTRTRRWTQSGRSGQASPGEGSVPPGEGRDPLAHADPRGAAGFERWRPSFGHGVAFPDGIYDAPAHPGAPPRS